MKVLVVGGAGYIGSHTARCLLESGHEPILFDNLIAGHPQVAERLGIPLIQGDLNHPKEIFTAVNSNDFDAVLHFAAFTLVGESVMDPSKYYQNNLVGTCHLLDAIRSRGIKRVVFSSTCAIYGLPQQLPLREDHPQLPINPYGRTKQMIEQMLADYDRAYGIRHVALRYFNAAGASHDSLLGEDHHPESHLIPICLQAAAGLRDEITIFGTDYDTIDGTCVRDYVHVEDLARAHVAAISYLREGGPSTAFNVGSGRGYSVREVLRAVQEITDLPVVVKEGPRREGDPPRLVADPTRIHETLRWKATQSDLHSMVESAWRWFQNGGHYAPH